MCLIFHKRYLAKWCGETLTAEIPLARSECKEEDSQCLQKGT